jgi:hypothetical protein
LKILQRNTDIKKELKVALKNIHSNSKAFQFSYHDRHSVCGCPMEHYKMLIFALYLYLLLLVTFCRAGSVIDGTIYVNSNNVDASWTIFPESAVGRGIFIVFTSMSIEEKSKSVPGVPCWDFLQFDELPLRNQTFICGQKDSPYMSIQHTNGDGNIRKYQLSKFSVLYFDATELRVRFYSDGLTPSYFSFYYFSDPCSNLAQSQCKSPQCSQFCPSIGYCWGKNNSLRGIDVNGTDCMRREFNYNGPDPTLPPTLAPTTGSPTTRSPTKFPSRAPTTAAPTTVAPTMASELSNENTYGIVFGTLSAFIFSVALILYINKKRNSKRRAGNEYENHEAADLQGSEDFSAENRVASPSISVIPVSPSLYGVDRIDPSKLRDKIRIHQERKHNEDYDIPPPPPPLLVGESEAGEIGEIQMEEIGEVADLPPPNYSS